MTDPPAGLHAYHGRIKAQPAPAKDPLFAAAAPRFAAEVVDGLRAIGCHELADELPSMSVGPWSHDRETGALSIPLLGRGPDPSGAAIVATGYGRSLPLRLRGAVFLELDNLGRIQALEIFDRQDVLEELRCHAHRHPF